MQSELNRFFGYFDDQPLGKNIPDDTTVFKARLKLCPSAFISLNDKICEYFYQHGQPMKWHGFRLLSVDGTTLRVPRWPDIVKEFPAPEGSEDEYICPLARVSQLHDSLNGICVSATIAPTKLGEQTLLLHHADHLREKDLLLGDIGMAAFWIFRWLRKRNAHFCIRLAVGTWNCAKQFVKSGQSEQIVELMPCAEARVNCRALGLLDAPLTVRLIRVDLPTGEVEVLCTSLLDQRAFKSEWFAQLYHLRWPVEEKFKRDKCRAEIENFSGKSGLSVFQDFHATIFTLNLGVILSHPTREVIEEVYAHCEHRQQINWASGLNGFREALPKLFFRSVHKTVQRLHQWFIENVCPIRPGRSYPRNHKSYKRVYYLNYKPCL